MYLTTALLPAKCSSPRVHCRDGRLHLLNIFVCCLVHFHNNNLHPSISFHVEGLQTIIQTDPLLRCSHLRGERRQLSAAVLGSGKRPLRGDAGGCWAPWPLDRVPRGFWGSPSLQCTPPCTASIYLPACRCCRKTEPAGPRPAHAFGGNPQRGLSYQQALRSLLGQHLSLKKTPAIYKKKN